MLPRLRSTAISRRLSEKVSVRAVRDNPLRYCGCPEGGFEFTVFPKELESMAREAIDVCL